MQSLGDGIIRLCDIGFASIESARRWMGRHAVETVSTDELHSLIEHDESSLVLVDVRSVAEQSISKIQGAVPRKEFEANLSSYTGKQVIVYCTVGGRGFLYARKLVKQGIDAKNYRAGILGWCRAGLPLETLEGDPTVEIHPYWRIFNVPAPYKVTFRRGS